MKTTYLLGAGASANALPVVKKMEGEINDLFKFIGTNVDNTNFNAFLSGREKEFIFPPSGLSVRWNKLKKHKEFIINELKKHQSIDTVAKIFYSLDNENYNLLKAILIAAFLYWERRHEFDPSKVKLDSRYQNFWATLMRTQVSRNDITFIGFPERLNILTWNYDNQIYNSLSDLFGYSKWERPDKLIQNIISGNKLEKNDDLCLIKLNGTAGFNTKIEYQTAYQRNREPTKNEDMDDFKKFLGSIILFSEKYSDYFDLRFSWEKESFSQRKDIECAIAKSYGTNNLVIIGYTFPSLNQEIDFKIIEAMSGTLKKIYFQGYDYNDSVRIMRYFENVYDFKDIVKRKFTPVDSVGFFIPNDIFRVNDSD